MKANVLRLLFVMVCLYLSPILCNAQESDCEQAIKISSENIDPNNPDRNYVSAYENLALAKKICGDERLPLIDSMIMMTVKLMSEETERVKRAERIAKKQTKEAQKQTEEANKAKNETIKESQEKLRIKNAELNSRHIMETIPKNKTVALRMADYNLSKNGDQPSAAVAFQKALDYDYPYFKLVLTTEVYRTIKAVKFSADSRYILMYNSTNKVQVFDINGVELFSLLPDEKLYSLRFSEDSKKLIVENLIKDFDLLRTTYDVQGNLEGTEVINRGANKMEGQNFIDFDLSDSSLVSISQESINPNWTYNLLKEKEEIAVIDVSNDGKYLIIGFEASASHVWRIPPIRDTPIEIGYEAASETLMNQLRSRNGGNYQNIWRNKFSDEEKVSTVAFSSNRQYLLMATYLYDDYRNAFISNVFVYDSNTFTIVNRVKVDGLVCKIAMPPDEVVQVKLIDGNILAIDLITSDIFKIDSFPPPKLKLDLDRIFFELDDYRGRFSGTNTIPITDLEEYDRYIDGLVLSISNPDSIFYDDGRNADGQREVHNGEYLLKAHSGNVVDLSIMQKEIYSNIAISGIDKIGHIAFSKDKDLTAIAFIKTKPNADQRDYRQMSGHREIVVNLSSAKGKWTKEFKVEDIERDYTTVNSLSITYNNKYLSMCYDGEDNSMVMWDIDSTKMIAELSNQYHLLHGTYLSDNKSLVVKGSPGTSAQYLSNSEDQKRILLHQSPSSYIFTDLTNNEELLLIGGDQDSYNTYAEIWNLKKEMKIATIPHIRRLDHGKFSPDDKYVVLGAKEGTLILFDVSAKKVIKKINAHDGYIRAIGFSCDSKYFYSTGEDGFLRGWNLSGLEVFKQEFTDYSSDIQCGPHGENMLISTADQIKIIPTINTFLKEFIYPKNWHSLMGMKVNPFEASTLEDYQILSYAAERNRNWKDAKKYYEQVFKHNNDPGYQSRAMMMEASEMIPELDTYIDHNNGRVRQRFSKKYYSETKKINDQTKIKLHKSDGKLDFYHMKNPKNFSEVLRENQKAHRVYQLFGMPLIGKEENNFLHSQFVFFCIMAGKLDEAEGFSKGEELPIINLINKRYKKAERLYLQRYKMPEGGVPKHILQEIGYIPYDEIEYQNNLKYKIRHRFYLEEIDFYTELGLLSASDPEVQRIKKLISNMRSNTKDK